MDLFNFIYSSTIPHFGEARDPPPGISPGRVGVDLVTFGEQQRGIRSRKLASPQLLPKDTSTKD